MRTVFLVGVLAFTVVPGCKKKEAASVTAGAGSDRAAGAAAAPGCVTRLASGSLPEGDIVLTKACGPVTVEDEVWIDAKVTIEPGVTLRFAPRAALGIGALKAGTLIAQGTAEAPIVFTSAGDKVAGAWSGIVIMSQSHRSRLENAVIEYAGASAHEAVLEVNGEDTAVKNVTIRNGKGWGVLATGKRQLESVDGCIFQELEKGAMHLSSYQLPALGTNTYDARAIVEIEGGGLDENATLHAGPTGATYRLTGVLTVGGDAVPVLTLDPGVVVEGTGDGQLEVGTNGAGSLKAIGSADKPIRFTAVEKTKGGWHGIFLNGNARDVVIQHTVVEYADGDDQTGAIRTGEIVDQGAQATIEDVSFEHVKGVGLSVNRLAKVTTKDLKVVDAKAPEYRQPR